MNEGQREFLTELLGAKVFGPDGTLIGTVRDVVARADETRGPLPRVVGVAVAGRPERLVAWDRLRETAAGLQLAEEAPFEPAAGDVYLRRDVLDKQIVDIQDMRVVRVSDVRLTTAPDGCLVVLGVDPGQKAVIRRLLPARWGDRVVRALKMGESPFIDWRDVEPTAHSEDGVLRLRTARESLQQLHPADIADILEQMHPKDRAAVLESLDDETVADVVTEAQEDVRREIMEQLPAETAADILEEMEPDDAADVLADLSGSKRRELLDEMEEEEAEDVKELLTYGESTAGGLMTTEYVALPLDLTAEEAIVQLRELAPRAETIYYVYVSDPENQRLMGVISLRDLIVAAPQTPLWNFMVENVVRVGVDENLEGVASAIEHYDLLAVPVVDDNDRLLGIVTVDDTLEELLPPSWRRKRFRRKQRAAE